MILSMLKENFGFFHFSAGKFKEAAWLEMPRRHVVRHISVFELIHYGCQVCIKKKKKKSQVCRGSANSRQQAESDHLINDRLQAPPVTTLNKQR